MRHRSPMWITLAQHGRFHLETKARIGTKEYTAISAPRIDRAAMSSPLTVGGCTAATLNLSILTEDSIAAATPIVILGRLTDGINNSEWLEFGTFYINQRDTSYEGLITLDCYDAMLKANQTYLLDDSESTDWPKTMKTVVEEIAQRIGVSIDPRTQINVGGDYIVPEPTDLTMVQVLGYIGACHGGNWIITEENALRLVPLATAPVTKSVTGVTPESIIPQTYYITDENDLTIGTPEGHTLVWAADGSADPIDGLTNVTAVLGQLTNGISVTVTGVTMSDNAGSSYTAGTKDGYVISIESNPYATQSICDALYEMLNGLVYEPFTASKTVYDPATELGDQIVIGTKVQSILCTSKITMDIAFRSDITAPNSEALSAEYPYLTERKKAETATKQIQAQLNDSNYATKVQFEKTQESINAEVSRALKSEEELSTQISQNAEQIALRVTKGTISSSISLESGNIDISSNRISITSNKFILNYEGEIVAKSAYVEGEIVATSGNIGGCEIKDGVLTVPAAQISDKLVASQIDASELKVSAANITGTLTIGQLPDTVAEVDDIPTNVSDLNNDSNYQSPSGVVSIVDGRITADYIEALEISVGAAQITGKLTASQIDATNLKVSAANITGTLTIGQLPDTVAETSDIPTSLSDLEDDCNFVTESGVVSIVDGRITADYIEALGVTANAITITNSNGYTLLNAAGSSVSIGSFTVGRTSSKSYIYSGKTSYSGNSSGIYLGTDGIGLGAGTFYVTKAGSLYASNAQIAGEILSGGSITFNADYTTYDSDGETLTESQYAASIGASGITLETDTAFSRISDEGFYTIPSADKTMHQMAFGFSDADVTNYEHTVTGMWVGQTISELKNGWKLNVAESQLLLRVRDYTVFNAWVSNYNTLPSGTTFGSLDLGASGMDVYPLGTWYYNESTLTGSDRNIKNTITDIGEAYSTFFDNLRPVSYKYNAGTSGRFHTGFIAQEVESAVELAGLSSLDFAGFAIHTRINSTGEEEKQYFLRYEEFIALCVREIQMLKSRVSELENK